MAHIPVAMGNTIQTQKSKSNKSSNRRSTSDSNGAAKVANPTPPPTQIVSNGHGNASVAALASLSEAKKESDSAHMEVASKLQTW